MATVWNQLVDEVLAALWEDDPVFATACGIHEHDHRLASLSPEAVEQHLTRLRQFISKLENFSEPLSREEEADRQALLAWLRGQVIDWEVIQWHTKEPSLYLDHALYGAYLLLARPFAPLSQRVESLVHRLREVPRLLAEAQRTLRPAQVPPVYLETALETLEGAKSFLSMTVPAAVQDLTDESLRREALKAADTAGAALIEFEGWLKQQVAPAAQGLFAVGPDVFRELLRTEHLLTEDPDELEAIGWTVLTETKRELESVARSIDPSLPWFELIERLKAHHPPKDRIVETYREEVAKARQFVQDKGVATLPEGEQLRVVETPAFERATTPYAAYMPTAPFDAQSEGLFYVTPIETNEPPEVQEERLRGHCLFALPITVIHEAYPGHHLQLTVAARLPSKVRKVFGNNLFVEGWALYCEELMWELGYTDDLRVRLFQLKDLIWRAVRVIVDVGLHCKGMGFEEAVRWLVQEAHLEPTNAAAEVRRYTASPTQPLSYLIGKQAIKQLREKVQREEGAAFSLQHFHDRLLQWGGLPIPIVMRFWQ